MRHLLGVYLVHVLLPAPNIQRDSLLSATDDLGGRFSCRLHAGHIKAGLATHRLDTLLPAGGGYGCAVWRGTSHCMALR